MKYLSLFSGIEAASVAWAPLGWKCVGVAEIEPFPCKVLKHRYPHVPNLGDVTKITEADVMMLGEIDLVIFGSPCQDLSVAGKRKGLAGERSGLFHVAIDIIRWARQWCGLRWALWENVPGAFSSNEGRDFAAVVGSLAGLDDPVVPPKGWGTEGVAIGQEAMVEWAVLDAQWFGVAQRRRRVFALADFGAWADRPPVLLEPESLRGDSAPSRSARQAVAGTPARSLGERGAESWERGLLRVVGTLATNAGPNSHDAGNFTSNQGVDAGHVFPVPAAADCFNGRIQGDVTNTVTAGGVTDAYNPCVMIPAQDPAYSLGSCAGAYRGYGDSQFNYVTHHAPGEEVVAFHHNAQVDQLPSAGRDTSVSEPLTCSQGAAVAYMPARSFGKDGGIDEFFAERDISDALHTASGNGNKAPLIAFSSKDYGADATVDVAPTLRAMGHGDSHANGGGQMAVAYDDRNQACNMDTYHTLRAEAASSRVADAVMTQEMQPVAFQSSQSGVRVGDTHATLDSNNGPRRHNGVVVPDAVAFDQHYTPSETTQTLIAGGSGGRNEMNQPTVFAAMQVRRLTPRECERLQGFPDNWTLIDGAADGPRYKALGNSMAVPVINWIGRSIEAASWDVWA